jgi:hypothetical protein
MPKLLVPPLALMTLLWMVGEEEMLYKPMLFVPPEALAVTFVIVGEEEEMLDTP